MNSGFSPKALWENFLPLVCFGWCFANCIAAFADSVVVSNASFEVPALAVGAFTTIAGPMRLDSGQCPAIPGWGVVLGGWPASQSVEVAGIRNATNAVDGGQALFISASGANDEAVVFQDVGELKPNTFYMLTVAAGGPLNGLANGSPGGISLVNGTDPSGVDLGGISFTASGLQPGMLDYVLNYKSDSQVNGRLTIVLSIGGPPPGIQFSREVNFDNVRLDATPDASSPELRISLAGEGVILSWPAWATNYLPETSNTLSLGNSWVGVTNTSTIISDRFFLTNQVVENAKFYRLRKQ